MPDPRTLLQECSIPTEGLSEPEIARRAQQVLEAVERHLAQSAKILDEHIADEFQLRDADKTMESMVPHPYLIHLPTLTGGTGWDEVYRFYRDFFIPGWPADTAVTPVSRTVGGGRVIDELVVSFTHDRPMPAIFPGVAPTGRKVVLPHVVVVGLEQGKVAYEHIYWDQASALVQLGLLNPTGLPVAGKEAAERLLNPQTVPARQLLPE